MNKQAKALNDIPIELLKASIKSARESIQRKITDAVANGKPVSTYWSQRFNEIKKLYTEIEVMEKKYLNKEIPREYMEARRLARTVFEASGITRQGKELTSLNAIQAIIQDAFEIFVSASEGGQSQIRQLFRYTQQQLIDELKIDQAIASGLIERNTIRGVQSNIQKALYTKLAKDGRVFTVNRNTGGIMSFDPEYYAEMVARTRTREAQTLGVVNLSLEYGQDLVKVSSHNTLTPLCKDHEGKIYSITGRTKGYPVLTPDNRPPFHPNCWHVLMPYIPDPQTQIGAP